MFMNPWRWRSTSSSWTKSNVCNSQIDSNCSDDVHLVRRRRRRRKEQGENKKKRKRRRGEQEGEVLLQCFAFNCVPCCVCRGLLNAPWMCSSCRFSSSFFFDYDEGGFSSKLFFLGFEEFLSNLLLLLRICYWIGFQEPFFWGCHGHLLTSSWNFRVLWFKKALGLLHFILLLHFECIALCECYIEVWKRFSVGWSSFVTKQYINWQFFTHNPQWYEEFPTLSLSFDCYIYHQILTLDFQWNQGISNKCLDLYFVFNTILSDVPVLQSKKIGWPSKELISIFFGDTQLLF